MFSHPRIPNTVKLSSLALAISMALVSTSVLAEQSPQESEQELAKKDIEVIQIHGKKTDADAIITQDFLEKISATSLADIFRNQPETASSMTIHWLHSLLKLVRCLASSGAISDGIRSLYPREEHFSGSPGEHQMTLMQSLPGGWTSYSSGPARC